MTNTELHLRRKQLSTGLYGLAVVAVGIWRQVQTGDSAQAVWFGVVMGAVAILGGVLLSLKNRTPGYVLVSVSLLFVGWWFLRRMLSGHPDGTSVRVIFILVVCVVETIVLVRPAPTSTTR